MRAFRAIVGLTLRNAMRSHVFQLLLVLLIFTICVIPASIGGQSAQDFIKVSLFYSIGAISVILALSSLYLGCFTMSRDVENYQLHMVVSKPIARWSIWLGKWCGINIINFILLIISMTAVYCVVMYRYQNDQNFTSKARAKISREVLVGRRVYMPEVENYEELAKAEMKRIIAERKKAGQPDLSVEEQEKLYQQTLKRVAVSKAELLPGRTRFWKFVNIPAGRDLFLRYRPYLDKVSSEKQRHTYLTWVAVRKDGNVEFGQPLSNNPDQVFSGEFHEKFIPKEWQVVRSVETDSPVIVGVMNLDPANGKHYYQEADGPKLLVKICGFEMNYLRAVLVLMIELALLSGLACAFGGFLTMPTAIFMMVSYLIYGALAMTLTDASYFVGSNWDRIGQSLSRLLLLVVIPLQAFDVTDFLANGELIEFAYIGRLFLEYFIFRGVPVFLFGIWMYQRRELALAVRK